MNYFKKIIDWLCTGYEPEVKPKFRPKRVYKIKGRTYYLRKRKIDHVLVIPLMHYGYKL